MKEKDNPKWKMDTRCVHAGEGTDPQTKAVRRPIHMANSYELAHGRGGAGKDAIVGSPG